MNILELYSGIGGMHYALKESGVTAEVIAAVDINTTANKVYRHNFPTTKLLQRNIQSFTADEINSYNIDMILMSPPCQPFTRVGLKKDLSDNRTCSFSHLLKIFPHLKPNWKYLLVENVKGFEHSETCQQLLNVLEEMDFCYQQFILSPCMFSIPNTRHRYYLLAKRRPLNFIFPLQSNVMESLPVPLHKPEPARNSARDKMSVINSKHFEKAAEAERGDVQKPCYSLSHILESGEPATRLEKFFIPDKVLGKHAWLLDIVGPESQRSCCFTKAYGHYVEGTGSVWCPLSPKIVGETFDKSLSYRSGSSEHLELLRSLKLRYFTPREISRLMCFPNDFSFPEDITTKQGYKLLGNSINVHVVALLIILMTAGDTY